MMWPDSAYQIEGAMLRRSALEWRDQAVELERAAEASFDVEEIRLLNAYRHVVEAIAVCRQTHAEVTS